MNLMNVSTSRRALLVFIPISFAAYWSYLSSRRTVTMNNKTVIPVRDSHGIPPNVQQHPTYWFNDGSIIVRSSSANNQEVAFKLHESLLGRLSRFVRKMLDDDSKASSASEVLIPQELGVEVDDLVALLQHLYHDTPLSAESPFSHVAAILRVSSPKQLDLPGVHSSAQAYIVAMFPQGPHPFTHPVNNLEEALVLAQLYQIPSIKKGIYYSLITSSEFELESDNLDPENINEANNSSGSPSQPCHALPPVDVARCRSLMNGIVEHFPPILFTPPATPHMACTDVFADKWMSLVIQPAISNSGVCKPLEMLEQIKQIDWLAEGLCTTCVWEKKEEWTQEQEVIWNKMDSWLHTKP